MRRPRKHQTGSVWLRGQSFFIRYYDEDGKRKTEFLCEKDEAHFSETCPKVKDLAARTIERVNRANSSPESAQTAGEFWEAVYKPWAKGQLRPSTYDSYVHIWGKHLDKELGERALAEYGPADATKFLTKLAGKLGRNTVSHIRALMSGVFSHAAALGKCPSNPIRDAKILAKAKAPSETGVYTTEHVKAALKALAHDPEAACVFALAAVQALRPSEICGLKVGDVEGGELHVRRAFVRGKYLGETKTEGSAARVKLIEPARTLLAKVCEGKESWVFKHPSSDRPFDIREFARKKIKPFVTPWHGLYGGRRSVATKLVELTGQLVGAAEVLRHTGGTQVLERHYKKRTELGDRAMELLERELSD
jgi:integrase